MNTIDTAQLRARLAAGRRPWLVHAAEAMSFRSSHLPGAVAFGEAEQAAAFLRADDVIVVYGFDGACRTSRALADELSERGFAHVSWYAEGLEGWLAAGGQVEGAEAVRGIS